MGRTISIRNVDLSFAKLMRFIPAIAILCLWYLVTTNVDLDHSSILSMNTICIAGFIVLSSYALDYGYRIFGILAIAIGFGAFYTSYLLLDILTPSLLLQVSVMQILAVLETSGKALILFGAASFGLWLSTTHFPIRLTSVKYAAIVVSAIVVFIWIFGVTINVNDAIYTALTIPGIELIYSTILIITSSLFVPRRKFLTVFFFVLGIVLTLYGVSTFTTAESIDALLLGYYLRIIGTIFFVLFALPLGASTITDVDHPENPLYIIIVLWFFAELILFPYLLISAILVEFIMVPYLLIFSPVRVFALYAVIHFSMKAIKTRTPAITGIGTLVGFGLTAGGMLIFLVGIFTAYIVLMAGLCLSVIGYVVVLFCSFSFGEAIRIRLMDKGRAVSVIGVALILIGVSVGTIGILSIPTGTIPDQFDPFFFILLDTAFFVLVGLGSMFVVIKPRRLLSILAAIGFANLPIVLMRSSFLVIQFFTYPFYAMMVFFMIQHIRIPRVKVDSGPRKKKVVPMEITPETLVKAGFHKTPEEKPAKPTETVEPIDSTDFEPDTPPEEPAPVEKTKPKAPSKDDEPSEAIEEVVSEKAIKIEQQRIPDVEGEKLSDEERMARNWYNRSFNFLEIGDREGAMKALDTALKWQSDHTRALALKKELQEK